MKKFFKIMAVAAIAVAAAVACMFVGCGKDGNGDGGKSDYNFTIVYENGNAVNGQTDGSLAEGKLMTQICLPGDACLPLTSLGLYPDANGKISISQTQVNGLFNSTTDVTVFVFHAIGVKNHKNDCEVEVNGKGDYTLTITVA